MNKGDISQIIRFFGLIFFFDHIRYWQQRISKRKANKEFKRQNSSVILPPDYLLYETFALSYHGYYNEGKDSAIKLVELLSKYKSFENLNILDWGCGPGRIVRHLPGLVNSNCSLFGTDYNSKSINWCSKNIPNVTFSQNELKPPLKFKDSFFDIIYGISIFTHLSREMHFAWFEELLRILKPDGIMYLTTAGKSFLFKLTEKEKIRFNNGELIIRSKTKEGHRTYSAFHPEGFMQKLFSQCQVLEHIERTAKDHNTPQDIWILQK